MALSLRCTAVNCLIDKPGLARQIVTCHRSMENFTFPSVLDVSGVDYECKLVCQSVVRSAYHAHQHRTRDAEKSLERCVDRSPKLRHFTKYYDLEKASD